MVEKKLYNLVHKYIDTEFEILGILEKKERWNKNHKCDEPHGTTIIVFNGVEFESKHVCLNCGGEIK